LEKKGLEWDGLELERLESMGLKGLFFVFKPNLRNTVQPAVA
jgi:hypothetical protein